MGLRSILRRLQASAPARAARDTQGAAAAEFAIIVPALISLMIGTSEISLGVALDRKVTITARSLSDLVAQSTTISDADMTNIFNAAAAILTPYTTTPLKAKVSAVNIDGNGNATVAWGSAYNTSPRAKNDVVSIPAGLKIPNTQLIWSEITYDFKPPVAQYISGTLKLSDQFFARPRQSGTICRPPQVTTCS